MANCKIFHVPSMQRDCGVSGLRWVTPPNLSFRVDVQFNDKFFKQLEKDDILLNEMNDAAKEVYVQTCKSIQGKLKAFDRLLDVMVKKGAPQALFDKQLAGLNRSIAEDKDIAVAAATMAIEAVWKRYQAVKSESVKFKVKIGVTIAGAAAGLAVSIGLMAAGPFTGGASAAFSLIGMVKSCAVIGGEISKAAMSVEQAIKLLKVQLNTVSAAYKKSAALGKANEYTAAVVAQFLVFSQPSIKSVGAQMEVVEQKLNLIKVRLHKAAITLNEILDQQEEFTTNFMDGVKERLGRHPLAQSETEKIQAKLEKYTQQQCEAVVKQIDAVKALHGRWKAASQAVVDCRPKVAQLLAMRDTDVKVFENVLYLVDLPLAALNGNALGSTADMTRAMAACAANMTYDKIKTVALDKSILV